MNKEEFLNILRECLQGETNDSEIADTLQYYREYFYEEESKGRTEAEILQSMGNPRLIAHSIIDAHEEKEYEETAGYYDAESDKYQEEGQITPKEQMQHIASKIWIILGVVLALMVVGTVLKVLLPVIIVCLVFVIISRMFRGR